MKRILSWMQRHWLGPAIAAGGILVVAGAAWQGYRASQAQQAAGMTVPPTVTAVRGDVVLSVTAPGFSISMDTRVLSSRVEGSLDEILVEPGQAVGRGQLLARLDDKESFLAAVSAARLEVLLAQQNLDDAAAQAEANRVQAMKDIAALEQEVKDARYQLEIFTVPADTQGMSAEKALAQMKRGLDQASAAFDPYKYRSANDPTRIEQKKGLDAAQASYSAAVRRLTLEYSLEVAQASLDQALEKLDRSKDRTEDAELELRRAALAIAQQNVERAQVDMENLEIRAPFDGVILEVSGRTGQEVSKGTALITLIDAQAMQVRSTVIEEDLPLVQPGQPAELFFDALPDANVTGTLARVVPQRDSDTQAIYPVYITLDRVPEHLAAGMTVDASIIIAVQPDVLRLPRAVVQAHSDGTADVEVWVNGQVEYRTIQVGLRGDSFVEITGGLAEGEAVVAQ